MRKKTVIVGMLLIAVVSVCVLLGTTALLQKGEYRIVRSIAQAVPLVLALLLFVLSRYLPRED
jgi:hypothetical protein